MCYNERELAVLKFLNKTFLDWWIGWDGPIPWPPRVPDIIPLGFLLWDYVNDMVYRTKVRNIIDLQHN